MSLIEISGGILKVENYSGVRRKETHGSMLYAVLLFLICMSPVFFNPRLYVYAPVLFIVGVLFNKFVMPSQKVQVFTEGKWTTVAVVSGPRSKQLVKQLADRLKE